MKEELCIRIRLQRNMEAKAIVSLLEGQNEADSEFIRYTTLGTGGDRSDFYVRVNKMLDKEGPEFEKLLETYRIKQKKPLAVPYKRMDDLDIITKTVEGTTVYVVRKKEMLKYGSLYILWRRNIQLQKRSETPCRSTGRS